MLFQSKPFLLPPLLSLVFLKEWWSVLNFISDINNDIESIASMFADDTRVLVNIASEEDEEKMQSDLNKIYKWIEDNNMLFDNNKFKILYDRKLLPVTGNSFL